MTQNEILLQTPRGPKRRPLSGGYARGAEQRARIIQAALRVFGEEGYERASTRMIAREAGIQPPALQYYFDSKEGLHRACAEFLVEIATPLFSEPVKAARAVPNDATPEVALEALCDLMGALVDASLFSRKDPELARFSARAQSETGLAAAIMREKISGPIFEAAARLVALALRARVGEVVRLRTHFILSQVSALHLHRDSVLARLGWSDFDGPRREMVKAMLRAHTKGALSA